MDFRILGPLEVRDGGRSIELRRRKPRALLAVLVLHGRKPVSSDALIDALWGEAPPRTARAALQNYVAQLRDALGPGLLASRAGGYALDVSPEQIDLTRFERLTAEGRVAEGAERVAKLGEALSLWRGPPLADLAFEPFAAREASRLEELRTSALEDLIEAELSLGASTEVVAELEQLIAEHPFRERFRAQLMLALYRGGRQAAALEAYQETRRTLVDELGIEPSPPLRDLEQAILRQDPALGVPVPTRPGADREPSMEERRKTVTIVFADVAFSETLDPELQRNTSLQAIGQARAALERHGAMIEQRAGDEVMAVFGIPHAHEDDALRAARAALELRSGFSELGSKLGLVGRDALDVRVGIETGVVLAGADAAGHGFAAGPAVTLAKRTVQRAGPGEVVAGPRTLQLLGEAALTAPPADGRNDVARLVDLLEGVPTVKRRLDAPLVDREAELAALHGAFAKAVDERSCRLLLVLGEAGIGKTRLASELTTNLDAAATVLVGRCASYGEGAMLLPLVEIVCQARARRAYDELLLGDEHAAVISARLADLTGDEEAPGSGGETFWAARRLFESLAEERPLVLVFEDLHWAEPPLMDLLDYLAEQVSDAPILLLGLARTELLELRRDWSGLEATMLAPLSGEDGEALLENLGDLQDHVRTQILRTAGGNPLFIEQLLAHATEGGRPDELPATLDALLVSRLDHLEPGELLTVQRAAVAGREFSRAAVAHLLPQDEAAGVDEHLAAVTRKGLIHESGSEKLRFHHVLIRDSAYGTLPKAQRAELHERFARWLESRPTPSRELIGYHLEQAYRYNAELGVVEPAVGRLAAAAGDHLAAAGLRAAKRSETHAAANLLARASSLLEVEEVARRDLLTELGLVYWRADDLDAVEDAFGRALEAAVASNDRRAELRARVELAYLKLFRMPEGGTEELLSLTAEAIPALEQAGDNRTLGLIWDMLAHVHGGFHCHYRDSAEAAERAIAYFARAGWPLTPCLQELAVSLYFGPLAVEDAIGRCRALLEHADRGGEAHVLVFQGGLEAMAGRFETARSLASTARATYEELDWTDKIWANYAAVAADIELLAGDDAAAERLLDESCRRLEARGEQARLATQAAQLGEALYRQGRLEEARRWAVVAQRCAASDDASAEFSWRALRAKGLAREGAFDEARRLAEEAVKIAESTDAVSQHAQVLLDAGEVACLSGRHAAAVELAEVALRLLEAKGNVVSSRRARSRLAALMSG
jgi:DNA-binding SARP family transcriptional activator/class 3 adenylate cyclase